MKRLLGVFGAIGGSCVFACTGATNSVSSSDRPAVRATADDGEEVEDEDVEVALADVPAEAKAAAINAVPGLVLSGAEKEVEDGKVVYSLSGTAAGEDYEVEVTPSGEVTEVEHGDDEDDDD